MPNTDPPPTKPSSPGPLPRPHSRSTVDVDLIIGLVRPGDKLVVAIDRRLDMHTLDQVRERLQAWLPGVEIVPIEASSLVVYRPS